MESPPSPESVITQKLIFKTEMTKSLCGRSGLRKLTSTYHRIWISLGSKLAAAIGAGGTVRVNSLHQNGLREAHKSPRVIASAYSPSDFLIEGLESLHHTWVLGIQCHPERTDEVPRQFQRLFQSLAIRAEEWRCART